MNNTNEELIKGRISAIHKNNYTIRFEGKDIPARLKGSFYDLMTDRFPVVGDYVSFEYNPIGDSLIVSVLDRSGLLQRPDQAKTGVMQYMVANVDYTFIVTSLNEDYSYNRIARYVSVVLQGHSIPVVVLTKSDLCSNYGRYIREVESISDKVKVHAISALYGIGTDELEQYMRPGVTICLMGSSGGWKVNTFKCFCW
ncbi:GTPase RsgA [Oribacterium sp. WCC10]|uniref:GTPase RsgA n=1 Tax=Oribacterium sp. WCC10 TaxID=1855343 RepID=UPI0008E62741|nr:GTPase RsgA [Oribacterium sp. WCC10]SFG70022.1 ribosome biogenesis GTPase [Oribacterium sp. WCC10]